MDAAKGIAILGVIAVHAAQRAGTLPPLLASALGAGRYGVQIFFLMSGLTLFASMRSREHVEPRYWSRFYLRRLLRLAPLAYLGAAANILFNHAPVDVPTAVATLTFTANWVPGVEGLLLGGWVLSVEVAFYLLAPVFLRAARSLRSAAGLAVAMSLGAYAADYAIGRVSPGLVGSGALYFWPPTQLPFMALGILLYHLTQPGEGSEADKPGQRSRLLALAVLLLVVAALTHRLLWLYLYPAALAAGILLSSKPFRALVNPATTWLGRISYSVFVWHFFVLDLVKTMLGSASQGVTGVALLLIAGVAGSVAVGWISNRVIEQPALRLARRITRNPGLPPSE